MTAVQWIVPALTGLGGALIASIPAMRRLSGRIKNSEASSLWEEGKSLREHYREDAERLRARLAECQALLAEIQAQLAETRNELEARRRRKPRASG